MAKTKQPTSDSLMHTPQCAAQHFAPWLIESAWLSEAVEAVKSGVMKAEVVADSPREKPYTVINGTAVIPIAGPMMKARSKFGGTSTVDTRRLVRMAAEDDSVSSILLHIDSPGGTVAGTADLATDVRNAAKQKPTWSYIEDMGASAAYWIASQTSKIVANQTALVGSIGTVTMLVDSSGKAEKEGIKVHVIATGEHKAPGVPGVPVTDSQIAEMQSKVNELNKHFLSAVSDGRGIKLKKPIAEIADGRVFVGKQAHDLGLVDEITTLDRALQSLGQETYQMNAKDFASFAAENPEAAEVKALFVKGHNAGKTEGRQSALSELDQMLAAFPADAGFAIKQFKAGRTVDEAKALSDEINAGVAAKEAAHKAEIDALKAKLATAETASPAPLNLGAPSAPAGDKPTGNPKAQAEWEWENEKPTGFSSQENYVAYRTNELRGSLRVMSLPKSA